ncbi:pRL2-19 [Streptomyces kaniharaensis]|uniref:PRL2-19 n=1 Tax=Streptomyces kaniharaensis TaxID=212423 RepID=A0A6N7L1U1_9ACTN|nr:pRL2-19 [Streptomyces kaniharaensis]MQS17966.1 pRL2-19 [Streptomyces kaniharaensis]
MAATPEDMSHAMLIAILMNNGGSIDLPGDAFTPDAIGGRDGAFHAVEMVPLPDGRLRLSVVARPAGDEGRIEFR